MRVRWVEGGKGGEEEVERGGVFWNGCTEGFSLSLFLSESVSLSLSLCVSVAPSLCRSVTLLLCLTVSHCSYLCLCLSLTHRRGPGQG